MRKLILSILLAGASVFAANAQQEFANIELPMNRAEDLITLSDDEGNVVIYFYQKGELNFTLLSSDGKQIAKHQIPYRFANEPQLLGTRVTDNEFIFYGRYVNGRREYLRPFAINRYSGAFRSIQDIKINVERNMNFVGGFGDKDHFYMLYTDRDDNIHLFRDSDNTLAHLEHKVFKSEKMPRTRDRYARESDMIYVHPDMQQNVFTGHHRSKIYSRGEKIHMIFDGFSLKGKKSDETTTEILTLDWNNGETQYRTLPAIDQRRAPSFNSFLFKNTLFRVHMEKDVFKLIAYDFNTLEPVKEYTYSGDEEIAIKSTPVYQRGARSLFSSDDNNVIEKTSKVMKSLSSGVPAITVDTYPDSTLQLTIGSYNAPEERRNFDNDRNRLVRTPDQYVQTSRGLMLIPGRWVPAYNIPNYYLNSPYYSRYFYDPFSQGNRLPAGPGISTFFRSVVKADDLSKASLASDDKEVVILQDKVENYENELKPEPELKTIYKYGDKLHYGYYDRKSRTFKIVEFAHGREPKAPEAQ